MDENLVKLLISILLFLLVIGWFITSFLLIRKFKNFRRQVFIDIENKNKEYYLNLVLKENNLFPYYERLKSGYLFSFKTKNDFDEVTTITLKNHYKFVDERVIYIINDELKYKDKEIVEIDNKKYLKLNPKIKHLEMLVSNDLPSHFMLRFEFKYDGDKVSYTVKEVENYGKQEESN